jgi:Flp pilus assembly protein TadG
MKNKHRQKGQAILEFAIILPVFVLIGFGLVDMQFLLERTANLEYVVNETTRCMAMSNQACTGTVTPKVYAETLATGLGMDVNLLKINSIVCNSITCTVNMTYPFKPLGVYFPHVTINRTSTAAQSQE